MCRVYDSLLLVWCPLLVPFDVYPSKNDTANMQVDGFAGSVVAAECVYNELKVRAFFGTVLIKVNVGAKELCVGDADATFNQGEQVQFGRQA